MAGSSRSAFVFIKSKGQIGKENCYEENRDGLYRMSRPNLTLEDQRLGKRTRTRPLVVGSPCL